MSDPHTARRHELRAGDVADRLAGWWDAQPLEVQRGLIVAAWMVAAQHMSATHAANCNASSLADVIATQTCLEQQLHRLAQLLGAAGAPTASEMVATVASRPAAAHGHPDGH